MSNNGFSFPYLAFKRGVWQGGHCISTFLVQLWPRSLRSGGLGLVPQSAPKSEEKTGLELDYTSLYYNACISGFPRGATPGVPPGTEGRLLRLSGNFIPGVAGIDSLLTIYGLHPRADPGDLFGQRLNLQKNVARDKMAERKASSFYVFYFLSICSHLLKQTICIFSLYGWMLKVRSPRRDTQTRKFRVSRLQKLKSFECLDCKN